MKCRGGVGKFENETTDRYTVILELALSDRPAEGLRVTRRIDVEVRYRHHSIAGGIELESWFCLPATNANSNDRGKEETFNHCRRPSAPCRRRDLKLLDSLFNGLLLTHGG